MPDATGATTRPLSRPARAPAEARPGAPTMSHPEEPRDVSASTTTTPLPAPAAPARLTPPPRRRTRRTLSDRMDSFISRLSTRSNFWHRVCSLIWLPYAFKSGIRMKRLGASAFSAVLPFRRFNKNWYNAMAGAALLANSEIAGGMYLFGIVGADYTVVCKSLEYKFLRPCFGPAIYRISAVEDVPALKAAGGEFNVTLELDIVQQIARRADKERRVGKCTATFHVTPKQHQIKKGRKVRP